MGSYVGEQPQGKFADRPEGPDARRAAFVVTGFSAFMDVTSNPTQVLVDALCPDKLRALGVDLLQHVTLAVSAEDVDAYMHKLQADLPALLQRAERGAESPGQPSGSSSIAVPSGRSSSGDGGSSAPPGRGGGTVGTSGVQHGSESAARGRVVGVPSACAVTDVVCLHLGVCTSSGFFRLESHAYNEASFRVPDVRGFQPECQGIDDSRPVGQACKCDLDLQSMCQAMVLQSFDARVSTDPGRYICNYIYYRSLELDEQQAACPGARPRVHSLFVHVPHFDSIPEPVQHAFLQALLVALNNSLQAC